jgi:hypothetical protein
MLLVTGLSTFLCVLFLAGQDPERYFKPISVFPTRQGKASSFKRTKRAVRVLSAAALMALLGSIAGALVFSGVAHACPRLM